MENIPVTFTDKISTIFASQNLNIYLQDYKSIM